MGFKNFPVDSSLKFAEMCTDILKLDMQFRVFVKSWNLKLLQEIQISVFSVNPNSEIRLE